MIQQHKHWRSKRVKTTLADRIGKDAARLWYTLSLQLQEADKRQLQREMGDFQANHGRVRYNHGRGGQSELFYEQWRINSRINLRHCKIERLKRFLNNLQ